MNIFITLDYEIFFGEATKDIDKYLIQPTQLLLTQFNKHNIKAIFFIDIGYLMAIKKYKQQFHELENDYQKIVSQIKSIDAAGHDIGLHVHPHWEDCTYNGHNWQMVLKRFKLADFDKESAEKIFIHYYNELKKLVSQKIVSYRAGGWCLEPFNYIKNAMRSCGIVVDSSVFSNAKSTTQTHHFNYTHYPQKSIWHFSTTPQIEEKNGQFIEIPITAHSVSPTLYWHVLKERLLHRKETSTKGKATKPSKIETIKKLLFRTTDVISFDQHKVELLLPTLKKIREINQENVCIIAHPKCFSNQTYVAIDQLMEFANKQNCSIQTFSQLVLQSSYTLV
jgi:hypothetical protein